MRWHLSHRADRKAVKVADRHYNRQKVGTPQFVPPGRCLVLRTARYDALWTTSWPFAEYTKHAWAGAWINSLFRNESRDHRASELIREAIASTRAYYGEPPPLGMVTFIDRSCVRPTKVRGEDVYGWTYLRAGFRPAECPEHGPKPFGPGQCEACYSETKGGLLALQLRPEAMPDPEPANGFQLALI